MQNNAPARHDGVGEQTATEARAKSAGERPERESGGRPNGRAVDKRGAVEGVTPVASSDAVKKRPNGCNPMKINIKY